MENSKKIKIGTTKAYEEEGQRGKLNLENCVTRDIAPTSEQEEIKRNPFFRQSEYARKSQKAESCSTDMLSYL